MRIPKPIAIDFETDRSEPRPHYPPRAVGVAIKRPAVEAKYLSWGHPSCNNCREEDARAALSAVFNSDQPLLFHNAKFDLAVACEGLGLPMPRWARIHDTMFLAFLADPHSKSIGLKQLAEELLAWAPEERDEVSEYVWENRAELQELFDGPRISRDAKKETPQATAKSTGEWLSRCPGDLVGRYAVGDVDRTAALFEHLYPLIVENGMRPAYNRERQVLPIFMENERGGLHIDVESLASDLVTYKDGVRAAEKWLKTRLNAPEINLNAAQQVAEALTNSGVVDEDKWVLTETGKRSTSKDNLTPDMYNDQEVARAFGYRNRMSKLISTFLEPWLYQAKQTGGTIHANWHQTRGADKGTRTGRPSTSSPNLLNLAKKMEGRSDGYEHPEHLDMPRLPLVRKYILPDDGHVFVHRDFSGQELRIFGHFESGELLQKYLDDPELDVHQFVKERVFELTGRDFERTIVKNITFGKLYGAGIPRVMELTKSGKAEAQQVSDMHAKALPGVNIVSEEIKRVINLGQPIRTWGGRVYYEEPRGFDGRDNKYKLINYLVQGSAADVTKEALIRWYNHPDRHPEDRFLVTVYDEINISAPAWRWREANRVLREAMNGIELDLPMLSDPKVGFSWGEAKGRIEKKLEDGGVWVEPEDEFLDRMEKEMELPS